MKKFLLILLLIIIIPIAALFVFLRFADLNDYKPQIEELALKYAKMNVKINGDLKVGISLKPSIELNNIDISNPENNAPVAKIGTALVKFSVMPLFKKEIVVDEVNTANTKVYYNDKDSVDINDLALSMESFTSPVNISFDTDVAGINIVGKGTTSSFKEIQDSNFNDISTQMNVQALGYIVNYNGNVTGLKEAAKAAGTYDVDYKGNKIAGDISVDLSDKTPYLKVSATSSRINLADFTSAQQAKYQGLIKSAQASELMPNTVIPYDLLKSANSDVSLNIKELVVNPQMALQDIKADLNLKNSVFKANITNITAGNGTISGTVNVNGTSQSAAVNLKGDSVILQNLYTAFSDAGNQNLYIKNGGKINFLFNLTTSGADTNQYLANLNGQVIAFMDESVLKVKSLEALQGNIISQILTNLKLNIVNKDLQLTCGVVRGDVNNGVINFPKGIAVDAKEFYLVANGTTNLKNDKINLELQPFSGKISDTNISSVIGGLLKIKGTFSQPKLALNQTETVKNIVGILATGGVYNAGDMMMSTDSSPCHTALAGTSYADYFKGSNSVKSDVSKAYTDTKDAVKDLGNQAKNLLKGLVGKNKK